MNPSDLVQEVGRRLNLTGLTLTDGVCRLVFDQNLPIDLEDDGEGHLYFQCVLAPLPHADREAIFRRLLTAHLFGLETDGASFGLHPQTDELYLFQSLPVEALDVEVALDVLERFTHQASTWRAKLAELTQDVTPAASTTRAGFSVAAIRA